MTATEYWVESPGYSLMLLENEQLKRNPRSFVGSPVHIDESDRTSPKIGTVVDVDPVGGRFKIRLFRPTKVAELVSAGIPFDNIIFPGSHSNPE